MTGYSVHYLQMNIYNAMQTFLYQNDAYRNERVFILTYFCYILI